MKVVLVDTVSDTREFRLKQDKSNLARKKPRAAIFVLIICLSRVTHERRAPRARKLVPATLTSLIRKAKHAARENCLPRGGKRQSRSQSPRYPCPAERETRDSGIKRFGSHSHWHSRPQSPNVFFFKLLDEGLWDHPKIFFFFIGCPKPYAQ